MYEYPKIISNITNNGRNSKLTQQRRRGRPPKSKDNIKTVKALKASGSSKLYSPRNQSSQVSDAAKNKYKRIINKYRELKSRKYSETSNDDERNVDNLSQIQDREDIISLPDLEQIPDSDNSYSMSINMSSIETKNQMSSSSSTLFPSPDYILPDVFWENRRKETEPKRITFYLPPLEFRDGVA